MKAAVLSHGTRNIRSITAGKFTYTVGEDSPGGQGTVQGIALVDGKYEVKFPNFGRILLDTRNVKENR